MINLGPVTQLLATEINPAIMKRFDGQPIMPMMFAPLMQFDEAHLEPLAKGTYTGTKSTYFAAVVRLFDHLKEALNNIYDCPFTQLGQMMNEKGVRHNLTPNNTLEQHAKVFFDVWPQHNPRTCKMCSGHLPQFCEERKE